MTKPKGLTLAIDFDGTLHDKANPVKGRRMGGPLPGALESITDLYDQGHKIIVFTTMATTMGGKKAVEDWLEYYDFDYHEVTATKPNASVFIDDKAIRHISWADTTEQLELMGILS